MGIKVIQRGKIAIVSFLLFCLSLGLTSYSARNPTVAQMGYSTIAFVVAPLQRASTYINSSIFGIWDNYISLRGVKEANKKLTERLSLLESENSRLLEFESENKRLRELLSIFDHGKHEGIGARIIGYDPSMWIKSVTLDRGSIDGIASRMPVIHGQALVGQIVSVSPNSSKALLITDHSNGVDVTFQGSRAKGILQGAGIDSCKVQFVSNDEEIQIGERLITSGIDGIYPKGLMIGIVTNVAKNQQGLFQKIEVKPTVHMSKLEEVVVLKKVAR